jgi:biotin carboxylase
MQRVLLLATTTGYQTRAFGDAAVRLGVELVFATDRCHLIEDPWQDHAIPIRFYDEDASVAAILEAAHERPIDGVLVVGDRPTVIAARVAKVLGLPGHPAAAAETARHKQRMRESLRAAGLPTPWFVPFSLTPNPQSLTNPQSLKPNPLSYPCVVKPVALSGSRGVMRADNEVELGAAIDRLRAIVRSPELRAERNEAHDAALIEGFIPGREYALEGVMHHGELHVLAIFDKPDPLDGPFFEETIYLTPSAALEDTQRAIVEGITRAAAAIGLHHGPVHAECRVNPSTREPQGRPEHSRGTTGSGQAQVFVLEVAARPIGGLCARALRFAPAGNRESGVGIRVPDPEGRIPLEELLIRHALGEAPAWRREADASGVMMIPIPRRGVLRGIDGVDDARQVPHVVDVQITAKMDQRLLPLPEGASYLGFIFARGPRARAVEDALRAAHACLRCAIDPEFPVLDATQIHYNLHHG